MQELKSKEEILKKIREGSMYLTDNIYNNIDWHSSVHKEIKDDLAVVFAKEFIRVGGKFIFCKTKADFNSNFDKLAKEKNITTIQVPSEEMKEELALNNIEIKIGEQDIKDCETAITKCEALVARQGSIMVSSALESGRRQHIYPDVHIVIANVNQIVLEIGDAMKLMREKYEENMPSLITMITGPSRTADIEKTLIMGMHGPRELYVFLIDE